MDAVIRDDKLARTPGHCSLSWSAVIAGALVAFSLSVLFNLLNAGLGLVSFPESFRGFGVLSAGAYIWLIICAIVAMFIAGWVAGRIVRHFAGACYGFLHGFLAWSLALLFTIFIAAHFAHAAAAAAAARSAVENRPEAARVVERATAPDTTTADNVTIEQAADIAGTTTLGIFFIFLLGALAAGVGGYVGAKNHGTLGTTKY